jgi:hypothetical protein
MSEPTQIAFVNECLAQMPAEVGGALGGLVLLRSALVLPILEAKIEEVLKSPATPDSPADKAPDAALVMSRAESAIAYAGDAQSFKEISKLLAIDEQRFSRLAGMTLSQALERRNPLTVAYGGFDIGDPAVDKGIAAWIDAILDDKYEAVVLRAKHWWAESLADRYGGPPSADQWASDPIASRLKPSRAAALHDDVYRLALEALTNRNLRKK